MKKRYAISDIHGCSKTLQALLFDELKIDKSDELFFIGDFIDRGPDSKGVLDQMIEMKEQGYKLTLLRGNHEQMLLDAIDSVPDMDLWTLNGCDATLSSFNVFQPNEVPEKYLKLIDELPNYYELENFILVHGGLNFDIEDPLRDTKSMLWMRNVCIQRNKIHDKRLIVGHTPKPLEDIVHSLQEPRILIDGGCCYAKRYSNMGRLVALDIDTMQLFYKTNIDM